MEYQLNINNFHIDRLNFCMKFQLYKLFYENSVITYERLCFIFLDIVRIKQTNFEH